MVVAEYKLDAGIVVSSELPVLDEGESIKISRCSYKGQASLLIEILSNDRVADAVVFPGLVAGQVPVELIQA
ncbi:hypothetical protein FA420_30840 [Pseudomonas aeruginosa]|uniref:hypothetical protein n=1 Tax=Pseudomonas aeruginosa TaxID=287 RepID=UPI001A32FD7B|nr:hypothetical protein [Pseudomonas aeruginosa]MBH9237855.1 hypothetical protein [Pseudomonas aeruginosa]MBO8406825.1 hypothetical protein [Pseudomonas aeruginosa]MCO1999810.1 hypothetical protein [Pseudomonas aeruginosa]HEJ1164914.1 hypothetical protein [Pseudomonas aeruginosa]HEJ4993858.1 hypothetical protein [Pseudomonas aeruginosa]